MAAAWLLYTRIFNLTHWKTTKWVVCWHCPTVELAYKYNLYAQFAIIYYVQIVSFMIVSSALASGRCLTLFRCIWTEPEGGDGGEIASKNLYREKARSLTTLSIIARSGRNVYFVQVCATWIPCSVWFATIYNPISYIRRRCAPLYIYQPTEINGVHK